MSDGNLSNNEDELNIGHYEGSRNEHEQRHGFGKAYFPNGDTYEGMYENGQRHGKGHYKFSGGSYYDGNYSWNKRDGFGIFVYPDGAKYEGLWQVDTRHGKGTYYYVNGDMYEGEWFRNRKNGVGKYTYKDSNSVVDGSWHDGRLNGPSKIDYGNFAFQGKFTENVVKGFGKFLFPKNRIELSGVYKVKQIEDKEASEEEDNPQKNYRSIWNTFTMKPLVNPVEIPPAPK